MRGRRFWQALVPRSLLSRMLLLLLLALGSRTTAFTGCYFCETSFPSFCSCSKFRIYVRLFMCFSIVSCASTGYFTEYYAVCQGVTT